MGRFQWLLGWDSLVPELNWKLNFTRAIAGAWQEYQGLGLTGGMAHLADLSRMIILWVVNLAVPTHYVRWMWHMGMLVLGPIGVWYLGKKMWKWSENACLAASVFYLLNLATVQYFFVPYEAFSSFYGFLPWLIAVFLTYLESGMGKDLSRIVLVGILATSAFYVQTLFVVYGMILGVLSLGYLRQWRRIIVGLLTVFGVNAFWLLPIVYGVINGGGQVGLAKINSIGSPETALMNTVFGNWQNVSLLKGYWLEYIEWVGRDKWGRLMQPWWDWSGQVWVAWVGQGLFGMSIFGSLWGVVRGKVKWTWLVGFLLAYIMMVSFNAPFGFIYQWLVDKIPLFGEIFRSVFTKWSIVLALFVSVGIGSLVASVKNRWVAGIMATVILFGFVGIVWPVFKTGIIFDKMKVELPSEYLKMFEYMKTQPKDGRAAYLPVQDMWSWKYTNWGYRGSGFLWYGIEQSILDRAFDVWSPYNEGFYDEFSTALYGANNDMVAQVLQKYDVRYVLLDESVIAPGQDSQILRIEETKKLAGELGWKQVFQEGFLTVWDTANTTNQFVSAPSNYTLAGGDTSKVRRDVIYQDAGTYATQPHSDTVTYPFAGLVKEAVKDIEYGGQSTTLKSDLGMQGNKLIVPGWKVGDIVRVEYMDGMPLPAYKINGQDGPRFLGKEKPEDGKGYITARVSDGPEWSKYLAEQKFDLQGQSLKVEVPSLPQIYDFATQGNKDVSNCDVLKRGKAAKSQPVRSDLVGSEKYLQPTRSDLQSQGTKYTANERGSICDYVAMPELDTRLSYLMRMQGQDVAGRSTKFFLYNTWSKRNDLEYLLSSGKFDQTFGLLPWGADGSYTLNISVQSFGQYTENILQPVEVRWFPIEQIAGARIIVNNEQTYRMSNDLKIDEVKKIGTWLYKVNVTGKGLLKLSQGYDEGWISIGLTHVKVDGWANGWIIPSSGVATIFYWPQLLEYLGFGILGGTVLMIIFWKK